MSLVFYDTETTGVDTHFDQILQFAAIKAHDLEAARRAVGQDEDPGGLTLIEAINQTDEFLKDENHPHFELLCEHREFLQTRLTSAQSRLNAQ